MAPYNEPSKTVFESEEFLQPSQSFESPTPKIVDWVIKYSGGAIKNEKQANYVLIAFFVVAIIVFFLVISSGGTDVPQGALENPEYGLPEVD